jgi:trehalose 6-phosphate synthase
MSHLIVASNRGPVSWSRGQDGSWQPRRGAGGLIVALGGALQRQPGTWVSVALSEDDRAVAAEHDGAAFEADTGQGRFRLRLVDVGGRYDAYYGEVANRLLWFTLHQLWAEPYEPTGLGWPDSWADYVAVNTQVAAAVVEEARAADGPVEVHLQDYHLLVAAPLVREALPQARIVLYIHTPWVHPTYLRRLPDPVVDAILDGLAACDLVGVSAPEWAQNLRDCMTDLGKGVADFDRIRTPSGSVLVRDFVLGIDAEGLGRVAASEAAAAARDELLQSVGERQLLVRADRTDLSKNVIRGIQAYDLLLREHPDLIDRVHFRLLLNPSRQGVAEYREYLDRVQQAAQTVQDHWGGAVLSLKVGDDFPAVVAALQSYDVLLTNAVIDGTNLVAKEGPTLNERDGVLVLSRNAGAATVMGGALTVNPYDVHDQAAALHAALVMAPEERARRAGLLRAHAAEGAPGAWLAAQQAALDEEG